jgi:hypothetical protein
MINDLTHLIFRQQLPPNTRVTGLTAGLAQLRILASQFFGFLPRLRAALLMSQAGFDGGSETRILSWREETLRGCHDQGSIPMS